MAQFKRKSDRESYDPKTVTLTAQSLVGAKVEEKFGLTSEDIEHAVMRHHVPRREDHERGISLYYRVKIALYVLYI